MDVTKLIYDPVRVKQTLKKRDGKVLASTPVKIMIPARYQLTRMASMGADVFIVGIFAIVLEDTYYAKSMVPAMIQIRPIKTTKEKVLGDDYLIFWFETGSEVIANTTLVKNDILSYHIFTEIIAKANTPWQMNYEEHSRVLEQSKKYSGPSLGDMVDVFSTLTAILSRSRDDRNVQYRSTLLNYEQMANDPPAFIPIRSIQYAINSTLTRLGGSHFGEGIISSLNNPTEKLEPLEALVLDSPLPETATANPYETV